MKKQKKENWVDNRENKDKARLIALRPAMEVDTALFLPSYSCKDLKISLLNKLITLKTKLIIIEKKAKYVKKIDEFLKKNGFKESQYYIHHGQAHGLNLDKVFNSLNIKKIDYVFFDICGNLTAQIAKWFNKYQDYFAENCHMPTTLAIHHRKKEFQFAVEKIIAKSNIGNEVNEVLTNKNNLLTCNVKKEGLLEAVLFNCQSLYYSFSKRNIKINELFIYKDTRTPMILIDAVIGGNKTKNSTFDEIAIRYSSKVSPQSSIIEVEKIRKIKVKKDMVIKNAYEIARKLGIFGNFESFDEIPRGKRAHITITAKKVNIDPVIANIKIQKRLAKYGLKA
jgi:hypothetical protein